MRKRRNGENHEIVLLEIFPTIKEDLVSQSVKRNKSTTLTLIRGIHVPRILIPIRKDFHKAPRKGIKIQWRNAKMI